MGYPDKNELKNKRKRFAELELKFLYLQPLKQRKVLKKSGVMKRRELKICWELFLKETSNFIWFLKLKVVIFAPRFDAVISIKTNEEILNESSLKILEVE